MTTICPIDHLLRWRLAQAEAGAPPAPRSGRLLELARPWWEVWPDRFQNVAQRLNAIPVAHGHAMSEPQHLRPEYAVPAVVVRPETEFETSARILYLNVREGRLRLRFQLAAAAADVAPAFEVTFVGDRSSVPLFFASAEKSVENEYRMEAELPAEMAEAWTTLRVTDRMPFRLILRPPADGA